LPAPFDRFLVRIGLWKTLERRRLAKQAYIDGWTFPVKTTLSADPMKPAAKDLERRRPVWEAMSELFLDTQLGAKDHQRIANVLATSGYSARELDRILWQELCPVLAANLRSPAGEWAGFDMQHAEREIVNHPAGALRRWRSYLGVGRLVRREWTRIQHALAAKRG
jgi:hypothetical protein